MSRKVLGTIALHSRTEDSETLRVSLCGPSTRDDVPYCKHHVFVLETEYNDQRYDIPVYDITGLLVRFGLLAGESCRTESP